VFLQWDTLEPFSSYYFKNQLSQQKEGLQKLLEIGIIKTYPISDKRVCSCLFPSLATLISSNTYFGSRNFGSMEAGAK
jgi:hypothetical protein